MFIDYMLKFEDQQEAETMLTQAGLLHEVEGVVMPTYGSTVDIIGTIWKPDGTFTTNDDGFKIPNSSALDGYHVNVRATGEIQILEPYKVTPATPYRVWA
jgi:hypothetical protein